MRQVVKDGEEWQRESIERSRCAVITTGDVVNADVKTAWDVVVGVYSKVIVGHNPYQMLGAAFSQILSNKCPLFSA